MLRVWIGRLVKGLGVLALATAMIATMPSAEAARAKRLAPRPLIVTSAVVPLPGVASLSAMPSVSQPSPPSSPLVAAVSLNAQTLTIYAGTDVVARAPISSGMAGHRTPTGVFSILQKARYHESNIYDNAPMPFMQRLTWSGVALHAGNLPGYPASHGCVRLPAAFAERLFGMLKMGTRVVVAPEIVVPEPIVHAVLPKPVYTPVTLTASPTHSLGPNIIRASAGLGAAAYERLLTPPEAAALEKQRAQTALVEAQSDARRMLDIAADSALSAGEASGVRQNAERDITNFHRFLERAKSQQATSADDETRGQAEASIAAFDEAIADATQALVALRQTELALFEASFADARRARDAEDAADRAEEAVRAANRGSEPITVFISRADMRVQVRQGAHTILDGDVTIRDAHLPLGTHVMTAGGLLDQDTGLRWTSVAMSDGATPRLSTYDALSRISIDPKLAGDIGRRIWSGATVLVSDQPASRETGRGTDFVILTK